MDVVDLREFYAKPLGKATQRLVMRRIQKHWASVKNSNILGLGYATPYLDVFKNEATRTLAFMPACQGIVHWPRNAPNSSALIGEGELPLDDSSIDFILCIHGLEVSDQRPEMLREIWRVLSPQGRVLFVVPNRRGVWARFDATPFGHGRPYSRNQLTNMLRDAQFTPAGWSNALFMPPVDRAFLIRSAAAWERLGLSLWPGFSGVLMVEAVKQVYSISPRRSRQRAGQPVKQPAFQMPAMQSHKRD